MNLTELAKNAITDATSPAVTPDGAIMAVKARIEGKNATVTVWEDRLVWSLLTVTGKTKREETVMRTRIQSVSIERENLLFSNVVIRMAGTSMTVRCKHDEARSLNDAVLGLISES